MLNTTHCPSGDSPGSRTVRTLSNAVNTRCNENGGAPTFAKEESRGRDCWKGSTPWGAAAIGTVQLRG